MERLDIRQDYTCSCRWKYRQAAATARKAYEQLAQAAIRIDIELPSDEKILISAAMIPVHEGATIRFPDN